MTLKERCQAGEAKLEQVSAALLEPRPEILDRCEADLQEVIGLLQNEPSDSPAQTAASDRLEVRTELLRLRHRIRLLALQVQQAANLCQGWIQLTLSQGYTDQGTPAVPPSQPQAAYEV
ncbi:MAG: hypothetical protein LAO55_07870 [Acidobacteriia bacterium]|nr:hypothetical protein [Terriglobia bacterium]